MKNYRELNIRGVVLDKNQFEKYLEKIASDHILMNKSEKQTYPMKKIDDDYFAIQETYKMLNQHIKEGIPIHPAGEWILDNFYVIEETVKMIKKELSLKKYENFLGISNGIYKGYARIYILASEIVAYTEGKIDGETIENLLKAYQRKKTLSMEEIWNIGLFLQISLIELIRDVCEKIYASQIQKYRAENIIERLVDKKENLKFQRSSDYKNNLKLYKNVKYPFIEYMSYKLKKYGKKAYSYLEILEEEVNKTGNDLYDVIKKEHFDIAVRKVTIGNCITSIKELRRINFQEIFENINGVEEILSKDPANVYNRMDSKTKEYYRTTIKNLAKKTKVSEIYIAKLIVEMAKKGEGKSSHVGYYLISRGREELLEKLLGKKIRKKDNIKKAQVYISILWATSIITSLIISNFLKIPYININSNLRYQESSGFLKLIFAILLVIPIQEVFVQVIHYISNKLVKPKIIPKMDFLNGIDEENRTMVIIPTIVKTKEKVRELFKNLEVYYIANKSENIYFTLLGDCSSGKNEVEIFDDELIEEGLKQVQILNEKYKDSEFPKFNFIYRERKWNEKEDCYMGWERKRGMINQFNEYLLGNIESPFRVNTIPKEKCNKDHQFIKYVITLDADTELVLETGLELVGAMAHILNKPKLNKNKNLVVEGYGIIQPRVGINMEVSMKNLFTKIYSGNGGTDAYVNAISDFYQDNVDEGIFTGKGIYDLSIFSQVLANRIPENVVLSHDLLEGNYLRCGLATDIMLMDGYPASYNSSKSREHRWIRGDVQILRWLKSTKDNEINLIAKYKIFDNLIRALLPIFLILNLLFLYIIKGNIQGYIILILGITVMPTIISIINRIVFKKEGEKKQKTFAHKIGMQKASIIKGILAIATLPDKAYTNANAIVKSIYRLRKKRKLLEWVTSEEAEKLAKTDINSYYWNMFANVILGVLFIFSKNSFLETIGFLWIATPAIMWFISKPQLNKNKVEELEEEEKNFIYNVGKKTWEYFKKYINEETNYLPPDNYQEERKNKVIYRTSSTNIALGMLAIISGYDLKYDNLESTIDTLEKMINTVYGLQKWNGHLYNWYDIQTLEPLKPRYISSVDSGNFVGFLYVVKQFLEEVLMNFNEEKKETIEQKSIKVNENKEGLVDIKKTKDKNKIEPQRIQNLIIIIDGIIKNTDFTKLYDYEKRLFSIGYDIEENKLTDSYYDLLASEARQTSLVAIAKKDIKPKHWYNLSRTLTLLKNYRGLISWSGTAFEYLMPNINIKKYEGGLLDESCQFMIMSQKEYAKKIGIPWGFSESAFYLKDLNGNYQYKAFGIPWLGLKRGLADEIVIAPYGSALAITEQPKQVVKNLRELEKQGMYGKYGFYEAIDYTPNRLEKGQQSAVVKTYMAHHQALILLSINNLFNNKILQNRFERNPEIASVDILLQENMPEKFIITKEKKEKPEKIKYIDYEVYSERIFNKTNLKIQEINAITNENYSIVMDTKGKGYSKYKNSIINRYKETSEEEQGIFFYIKNIKSKRVWSTGILNSLGKPDEFKITFAPDKDVISRLDGSIQTKMKVTTNDNMEIRRLTLKNNGNTDEILEISSFIEPVLSEKGQDYAHPAFNNLFLNYEKDGDVIVINRRERSKKDQSIYMGTTLYTEKESIGDLEFEIDKEKFFGRGNLGIPKMIESSKPFSNIIGAVIDPIIAMKKIIKIEPGEEININLIIAVADNKDEVQEKVISCCNEEKIKRTFNLIRARVEAKIRYLGLKGKDIEVYQKILKFLILQNPLKTMYLKKLSDKVYSKEKIWKYGISGDLPILLVKIKNINDLYVLQEVINAYEYYKMENIDIDLVIINEEKNKYENYIRENIYNTVLNKNLGYLLNQRAGIFILENVEDIDSIEVFSNLILNCKNGRIKIQIEDMEEEYLSNIKEIAEEKKEHIIITEKEVEKKEFNLEKMKYFNEYGAFSEDGKQYNIKLNKENRLPTAWSHIIANEKFGTLVTESMGGFTWNENSRLNKLTSWSNNQVQDIPSEIIYFEDEETTKKWSMGLNPMPDENDYYITYGFGYAKYYHNSSGLEEELKVFVPRNDSIKVNLLKLKNTEPKRKSIKVVHYIKPVLNEDEIQSKDYFSLEYNSNANIIYMHNIINSDFKNYMYVSSSEKIQSYTGSKKSFLGNGGIQNPEGLGKLSLNKENSLGQDSIVAVELKIELESYEEREITIILGAEKQILECKNMAYKYSKIENCKKEYIEIRKYWDNLLNTIQVKTPIESMNILLNGWAVYQTICCRLWARSAFYQSGGAYGFRDQLQDTMGLKYIDANIMREQIIKHSGRQFLEGDVEHWWHEETNKGIRTRFSDDLLWLPYLVIQYIEFTGDYSILTEKQKYLKGELLKEGEDEKYDVFDVSNEEATVYEHCMMAIKRTLDIGFGENGLPKIGSGDWNDGFSEVGNKGKGESVWLGFFLYSILKKLITLNIISGESENSFFQLLYKEKNKKTNSSIFQNLCKEENNNSKEAEQNIVDSFETIANFLKKNLNTNGWDGRWFKRAFTDNDDVLGSINNEECKIDSISQSWSVISEAGDNDKKYISMESLENHLVDTENGIIRLLDPPFEKSNLEPGYIKAYLPGVRENGGQYTHASIWVIIAEALLGFGDKAGEYFRMINPIEHSRTKEAAQKYKVEPYVVAADIYGKGNLSGRGGWTWYTGSSSWMYDCGIEYILGLKIEKGILKINPCTPKGWKEYSIQYKYKNSIYNIQVKNPNGKNTGVEKFLVNGEEVETKEITMQENAGVIEIEVEM